MIPLWSDAWRRARLFYWRQARKQLTRKNPTHPDLPMIVRRVHELENPNRNPKAFQ